LFSPESERALNHIRHQMAESDFPRADIVYMFIRLWFARIKNALGIQRKYRMFRL